MCAAGRTAWVHSSFQLLPFAAWGPPCSPCADDVSWQPVVVRVLTDTLLYALWWVAHCCSEARQLGHPGIQLEFPFCSLAEGTRDLIVTLWIVASKRLYISHISSLPFTYSFPLSLCGILKWIFISLVPSHPLPCRGHGKSWNVWNSDDSCGL